MRSIFLVKLQNAVLDSGISQFYSRYCFSCLQKTILLTQILILLSAVSSFHWVSWAALRYVTKACNEALYVTKSDAEKRYWEIASKIRENKIIELLNNNSHGLSPSGGLVSPSGGFVSLLCDQGLHFASIKLCLALSHQGAKIKIPVVRCHYLLCLTRQSVWSCSRR